MLDRALRGARSTTCPTVWLLIFTVSSGAFAQPAPSSAPVAPTPSAPPSAAFPIAPPAASPSGAASAPAAPSSPSTPSAGSPNGSPPSARVEQAEQLFKRAAERMDVGDFEAACPLLEQSQAADPSSGTLLNLGDCYEHLGRTASAENAFSRASDLAKATGRNDRLQVAEARRQRLAPRLRYLNVVLLQHPPDGFALSIDEKPVALSALKVPVDPGVHRVHARAPGFSDYSTEVGAPNPSATLDVRIPALVPATGTTLAVDTAPAPRTTGALGSRRIAAIACGAVGIVGVVSGSVFGLRSMSKHDDAEPYCNGGACTDQRGVDALESARSAGNWSTASFIVGGVGLGAAAALWFWPTRGSDTQLAVGPMSLKFQGRF